MKALNPQSIRRDFPLLSKSSINKNQREHFIYFDNASSCLTPVSVIENLSEFYRSCPVNIHRGNYPLSHKSTQLYEEARDKVKSFLKARHREEIIFVRGTTEGINLVASSWGESFLKEKDEILISQMEHHSNFIPWQKLAEKKNLQLKIIPLNSESRICKKSFKNLLTPKTKLVALSHCSNTLGTRNDLKEFIEEAHQTGARVLVDGAQATPHFPVDVEDMDCDFYVFSSHKIFGPYGAGVLFGKRDILQEMPPYQTGGGMVDRVSEQTSSYQCEPLRFEAGTPAIADVIGLGAALDYIGQWSWKDIQSYEQELLSHATESMQDMEKIRLYGAKDLREKAPIISFNVDSIHCSDVSQFLCQKGICLRAGHHCSQPLMKHLQVEGTLRISFSIYNTKKEIDLFIQALHEAQKFFESA